MDSITSKARVNKARANKARANKANMSKASMSKASVSEARASISEASMSKARASISEASMSKARANVSVSVSEARANVSEANVSVSETRARANVSVSVSEARASISEASISEARANVSVSEANKARARANVSVSVSEARASVSEANKASVSVSVSEANKASVSVSVSEASMSKASMSEASMSEASMSKANTYTTSQRFNTIYCNNCSSSGHTFNSCKFPITSVGLIAFRYNLEHTLEYLLICRKDTIGYIEFMRGKYAINNKRYIKNILSEMTLAERQTLLLNDFDTLWYQLWGDFVGNQFRSEEKNARDKFESLKLGLHHYSLETLIKEIDTTWLEPEWGFPKGRHNNLEKDLSCGLREFEEETGYPTHCIKVIQNLMPYEEIFTGSNYKSYKHKYYVGQIEFHQQQAKQFQVNEISKTTWCTYEKALELIRPYNLEKLDVLRKVNRLLNSYNTF